MRLLTDSDLQAIKDRVIAASRGPWGWKADYPGSDCESRNALYCPAGTVMTGELAWDETTYVSCVPADEDFIAHARSDVPRLVAELEYWREGAMDWKKRCELFEELLETAVTERPQSFAKQLCDDWAEYSTQCFCAGFMDHDDTGIIRGFAEWLDKGRPRDYRIG